MTRAAGRLIIWTALEPVTLLAAFFPKRMDARPATATHHVAPGFVRHLPSGQGRAVPDNRSRGNQRGDLGICMRVSVKSGREFDLSYCQRQQDSHD